ncbi:putative PQ-loop protein [Paratrimastix pyriformis]|uniref:PQ-loop protein n=1 Tax=Paratrimastix pyriformis TaxID=342808 RepID=A0ABQ8UXX9_9EUKA|nr:putative PQ-loop protein [Paratrimastix pyriformis]
MGWNEYIDVGVNVFYVVAQVVGFFPQYRKIWKTRDSAGFSRLVCFALFVANITKLFFFFGKRFAMALLVQAVIMIIIQSFMLEVSVRFKSKKASETRPRHRFWNWDTIFPYFLFLVALAVTETLLTAVFVDQPWFFEVLGSAALLVEATVPLPQFVHTLRRRTMEGFSLWLMCFWLGGGIFKVSFYLWVAAPIQFLLCACFQCCVNFGLAILWVIFRDRSSTHPSGKRSPQPPFLSKATTAPSLAASVAVEFSTDSPHLGTRPFADFKEKSVEHVVLLAPAPSPPIPILLADFSPINQAAIWSIRGEAPATE